VRAGADYDTAWARRYPARLARVALVEGVARPSVAALARPERHGLDRLDQLAERGGPVIFAANHHSHVDTPLLLTQIPEPWRNRLAIGAAADYFFPNRPTAFASALFIGAVPVDRHRASRRNIDDLVRLLRDGWSTVLYPEGGRSPDGWAQEFKGGAAFLAKQARVPVVPVYLEGTRKIMPKGSTLPRRAKVLVHFGTPLHFTEGDNHIRFTDRLQRSIESLADESATDWWRARQRLHADRTPAMSGPEASSWRRRWELTARDHRRPPRRWP
jgi:1-acyl-sn-glycerol-3-phosphate acyltransferase